LSDALELVLDALGASRGLAYAMAGGALELVSHRGLPQEARGHLDRLALEPPWFVAQSAAQRRAVVVDRAVVDHVAGAAPVLRGALASAGWSVAVAAPIVRARQVLGVLVVAHTTEEITTEDATAFLETSANTLALALPREAEAEARDRASELHTAQMAALGMLAAGLADELSAPLDALALLLEEERSLVAAVLRGTAEAELMDLVHEAATNVERARSTTARLLSAVRAAEPESIDLAELARDVVALAAPSVRQRGIDVDTSGIAPGAFVFGRREELAQVLLGLLLNAVDACTAPASPCVSIGVRREGARVVVVVEDSGPGVPVSARSRVFEPFFTTKPGALGLGLALAKHVVVAHRGHIEVASSQLGGASFRVLLPAVEVPSSSPRPRPSEPPVTLKPARRFSTPVQPTARPVRSDGRRVLWIDDEPLFLRSIKRALARYDLVTATSAAEAEAELERPGAPFSVVFCDVALPDRSGDRLHAAVHARAPELARRFVFVTGGVISPEVADSLIASGCPTLIKPIDLDEVVALIEKQPGGAEEALAAVPTLREAPTVPPRAGPSPQPPTRPEMPAARPKREPK
jgi:signal transduction histidine kinase/DNA-binding NarL/FixJ family response regulator